MGLPTSRNQRGFFMPRNPRRDVVGMVAEVTRVSPFDEARQRLGLSCREFAATLGIPYSSCYNSCAGLSLVPRNAAQALRELGVDPEALGRGQRQWLEERGQQRRADLRARLEVQA